MMNNIDVEMFCCYHCQSYQTSTFHRLITHLRLVHSHQPHFTIRCGVDHCEKVYSKVDSYVRHVKNCHIEMFAKKNNQHVALNQEQNAEVGADEIGADEVGAGDEGHEQDDVVLANPDDQVMSENDYLEHAIGMFILKMREIHNLPKTTLSKILGELYELLLLGHTQQEMQIRHCLSTNNIDITSYPDLNNLLKQNKSLSAMKHFSSEANHKHFIERNLHYVAPIEYNLGGDKDETFMYVPILQTLKSLLKHADILTAVMNTHKNCQDGILQNFCDGSLYRQKPIFEGNGLQIQLFNDDFEVCNPLGTFNKKHKMNAMYFVLGNIPSKYRSKLHMIQLVWLCKTSLLQKYGLSSVANSLIRDLKILETSGIELDAQGFSERLKGSVSFLVADNLGSHGVGGFFESFIATRICRTCMCTYKNLKQPNLKIDSKRRTISGYAYQLKMIKAFPSLAPVYGIKHESPFNKLQNFHVINGLPQDPMHDLLEGVCPLVWGKVLTSLILRNVLSLDHINYRLKTFQYMGSDKSSKPALLTWSSSKVVMRQTASQMWCFCRLGPLLFGNVIPLGDDYWDLVLQLNDVMQIVFAPRQSSQSAAYLHGLVIDFLNMYLYLFPESGLTPKMHYLLHYSELITQFGPLTNCSAMRFEAKHSYFKDLARKTKNNRNLAKTLSTRHQNLMSLVTSDPNMMQTEHHIPVGIQSKSLDAFSPCVRDMIQQSLQCEEVSTAKSVTVDGTLYGENFIVASHFNNGIPHFAIIDHIILHNAAIVFLVRYFMEQNYSRHYSCYIVSNSFTESQLLRHVDLLDYHPLSLAICIQGRCIAQRYQYLEEFN